MEFRTAARWDEQCGISVNKILPLFHQIEDFFKPRQYGEDLKIVHLLIDCMGYDFKDKKRFKKAQSQLDYDIMLDYFMIKNVPIDQKQAIVRNQIISKSEPVFRSYRFKNFHTELFLAGLKEIVRTA